MKILKNILTLSFLLNILAFSGVYTMRMYNVVTSEDLDKALKNKDFAWVEDIKKSNSTLFLEIAIKNKISDLFNSSPKAFNVDEFSTLLEFAEIARIAIDLEDILIQSINSDNPAAVSFALSQAQKKGQNIEIMSRRGLSNAINLFYKLKNSKEIIRLLMKYGANPYLKGSQSITPIEKAKKLLSDAIYKKQGKVAWAYGKAKGFELDVDEKNDDQEIKNLKRIIRLLTGKASTEKLEENWDS